MRALLRRDLWLKCLYYKRQKGETMRNLCMSEMAILGVAGESQILTSDEVIDTCLSETGLKNCPRLKWVEREKDKETLKNTF